MERVTTTTISRGKSQSVFEQKGQRVKVWCYNTELITEPKVQHEQYNTADSEPVAKLAGTEEEITNRDQDLADTELKTNTDWIRKIILGSSKCFSNLSGRQVVSFISLLLLTLLPHCSHGNTTSPHAAIVIAKTPPPQTLCLTVTWFVFFLAMKFVYFECMHFVSVNHTLTVWVTKFLQCSAHGGFDSQVPPFGAHGGGPGQTDAFMLRTTSWVHIHISESVEQL